MSIDVSNESGSTVDEVGLVALSRHVLDALRVHPQAELSLLLLDEAAMEHHHLYWMDEPGPTDVLAFPMDQLRPGRGDEEQPEQPALLGDVVLCVPVAQRQAREAGHSVAEELNLLCTHGILHLLGYDHAEPEDEREMFGLQTRLLASWAEQRQHAGGQP